MSDSPDSASSPVIVVVGSINMDLVLRCAALPVAGQTLTVDSFDEICGGKGANQAVAAAKVGGDVRMIGRVGDDAFAERLVDNLRTQGVDCEGISATDECSSGLAVIAVEASGENTILIVPGANARVSAADVDAFRSLIRSAGVLLLQLEVPTPTVLATMQIARDAGVFCILDPAPVPDGWTDEFLRADFVCPNETEAAAITGQSVDSLEDARRAAVQLQERGAKHVAITLGDRGVVLLSEGEFHHIAATPISAVDTTAAGDAFAGAVGVRWAETRDLREAVRFASIAGALAATRHGAQPSLATRTEIETLRKNS